MKKIILFQGDSITDGNRIKNNTTDLNHQIGHSYAYVITGKLTAEYPQAGLHFINRGISGNTVQDLAGRWQTDCLALKPDVLSILVGVNDVHYSVFGDRQFNAVQFMETYSRLIAQTRQINPDCKIILCEPFSFCLGGAAEHWEKWSERLQNIQQAVKEIAVRCGTWFLPLQDVFDEQLQKREASYWMWDGVHPTEAGHWLIAHEWMKLVQKNNILSLE